MFQTNNNTFDKVPCHCINSLLQLSHSCAATFCTIQSNTKELDGECRCVFVCKERPPQLLVSGEARLHWRYQRWWRRCAGVRPRTHWTLPSSIFILYILLYLYIYIFFYYYIFQIKIRPKNRIQPRFLKRQTPSIAAYQPSPRLFLFFAPPTH